MARYEFEGRSAAEAAIKACEELGITRAALRYDVVSESGAGIDKRVLIAVNHEPLAAGSVINTPAASAVVSERPREPRREGFRSGGGRDDDRRPSRGDRPDRGERSDRGGRGDRGERGRGDRSNSRGGRGGRGERDDRGGMGGRRAPVPQEADDAFEALLKLGDFPENGVARSELTGSVSEKAIDAKTKLEGMLTRMHFEANGVVVQDDAQEIHLDIRGADAKRVIGSKGEPLLSLQFLVNRMISHESEMEPVVVLDVAGYRDRRRAALADLARKLAQRAVAERKIVKLSPMSAHDRRVFHLTLTPETGVTTQSEGEGLFRRLLIIPSEFASKSVSE